MATKTATLNTGATIPLVGLGCWMLKKVEADNPATYQMVLDALRVGYRHLDTVGEFTADVRHPCMTRHTGSALALLQADGYGNEQAVGKAVRDSGIPRKDIFVTTKLKSVL